MPEALTSQLVAEELKRLLAAFPRNLGGQNPTMMAEVYKGGLRGIDGDALRGAVQSCIQTDTYFPKVARLREAAAEWTRRNRPAIAAILKGSWDTCGVCGARALPTDKGRTTMLHDAERHNVRPDIEDVA